MVKKMPSGETELFDQLGRCCRTYGRSILLVEGRLGAGRTPRGCIAGGRSRGVPYLAVQATLLKVQEMGVDVLWTNDSGETAKVLKWLWERANKGGVVQFTTLLSSWSGREGAA